MREFFLHFSQIFYGIRNVTILEAVAALPSASTLRQTPAFHLLVPRLLLRYQLSGHMSGTYPESLFSFVVLCEIQQRPPSPTLNNMKEA